MVILSHPTGNANSRQALLALYERNLLAGFYTTVAWDGSSPWNKLLPAPVSRELNRRAYPGIPRELIHAEPAREVCRALLARLGIKAFRGAPGSPFSVSRIYEMIDGLVAEAISSRPPKAVFGYEEGCLQSFRTARRMGVRTIFEVPAANSRFRNELFREEAELQPAFAGTLVRLAIDETLGRKDEEIELADQLIVPSHYVRSTFPASIAARARVIPYGAPAIAGGVASRRSSAGRKLRVLFVGNLTQGKGLSYLLDAIGKVEAAVEFTMIGSREGTCAPRDKALQRYRWMGTVPRSVVLETMSQHDVLALPTLSEGFALVILEAMSRGLAVITTPNSGGLEVISDGKDGFIIPIRSSEALAAKLELLDKDRELLQSVSEAAQKRAQECGWEKYRELLGSMIEELIGVHHAEC
jgi:glycosyltransferase involved in cell wall biosynthesis